MIDHKSATILANAREYAETVNMLDGEAIRLCSLFQYMGQSKDALLLRINNFWQTLESHKEELKQNYMDKAQRNEDVLGS